MSQNGFIFPNLWGENEKYLSCHHLDPLLTKFSFQGSRHSYYPTSFRDPVSLKTPLDGSTLAWTHPATWTLRLVSPSHGSAEKETSFRGGGVGGKPFQRGKKLGSNVGNLFFLLLMVQKSGDHQLRLVFHPNMFKV